MRETKADQTRQKTPAAEARADRLKAALKANIAKRKAQARKRKDGHDAPTEDKA